MGATGTNIIQALLSSQERQEAGGTGASAVNLAGLPSGINLPGVGSAGTPMRGPQVEDLSKSQAGGPDARTPQFKQDNRTWFNNAQEIRAASQQNAVGALMSSMQQAKQNKFEKQASEAAVVFAAKTAQQTLDAAASSKTELPPQEVAQLRQQVEMASKIKNPEKLIEMAMKDPMSGAYVGFTRANSQESKRRAAIAEQDKAQQAMMIKEIMAGVAQQNATARQQGVDERGKAAADATEQRRIAAQNKLIEEGKIKGHNITFNDKGNATSTPFTQEQIDVDKGLRLQQAKEIAYTNAAIERAKAGPVKLELERERLGLQEKLLNLRALHESKQLDQSGGVKFTGQEYNRMDMAQIGQDYLKEMQDILKKRGVDSVDPKTGKELPALFGQGAWGRNKMAVAVADQDTDATRWQALSTLITQPMVGMHFRNAQAVKDMHDLNSGFYKSPESAQAIIDEQMQATERIKKTGGRPEAMLPKSARGASSQAGSESSSSPDPFAAVGGKAR